MAAEMRKRLWTTVLELLLQTSIDAYMFPLLCLDDFDCEPPSNLNDADFDNQTSQPPPSKPDTEFTQTSIQLLLHQSLRSRLDSLKFLNKIGTEHAYDTVLWLSSELKASSHKSEFFFRSVATTGNHVL